MAKGINEPMFWVEKEKRFRAWKLRTERLFFRVATDTTIQAAHENRRQCVMKTCEKLHGYLLKM